VPYWFNNEGKSLLVVRVRGDVHAAVAELRNAVRAVDPDVAIAKVAALQQVVEDAVEGRQYQASLFTSFGASALLIAVVGIYATTAYGISRRRREMNIRVALGARVSQVFALVLRQSVRPVLIGLIGGLLGAVAIGGVVASLLYEVRPRDPLVLGIVVGLVAAVGTLSAAAAARRGLVIEPAAALREE
jgi:ABC-type antimicrobial peptide transport system permease subunit